MKTDFSIQRINLLLRKDWIENKKKLAYGVLVILGVLFFFLLSSILWATRFRTFTLYVLGSLGTFIAFCSYVNLMIHRPRGLFLTLPASNQEKFAAILIEGIVVFLTYQVTFWTGTGIASPDPRGYDTPYPGSHWSFSCSHTAPAPPGPGRHSGAPSPVHGSGAAAGH